VHEDPSNNNDYKRMGIFMTVPFVLALPPMIGWFLGRWLDKLWGTAPYLTYGLLFLGIFAGGREFYRIVKRYGNGDS
jgi:ATP synthase protein I